MLKNENIICISWLNWDPLPLIMHQMMTRLSKYNRVLFVDPTIALSTFLAHPKSSRFLARKLRLWLNGVRLAGPNLSVYYPPPLLVSSGHCVLTDAANQRLLGFLVTRVAATLGLREPILWVYDPYAVKPVGQFGEKLVCYDCNDEISSFARFGYKKRNMRAMEGWLAQRAHVVFATSRGLYEKRKAQNANTHYVPSGVDFDLFNRACLPDCEVPEDIASLPQPVIGYHGSIANYRIEWEWIGALSKARPDASIVFIGPYHQEAPPEEILQLENVHFLGAKPPSSLPGYLRAFAVGIIPYKGREFLQGCQPTKTFEYLSAGKMVVSSLIPELKEYPSVAKLSADPAEFVKNVDQAIRQGRRPAQVARCVETARESTWDARVEKTSRVIEEALARKRRSARAGGRQPVRGPMGHE